MKLLAEEEEDEEEESSVVLAASAKIRERARRCSRLDWVVRFVLSSATGTQKRGGRIDSD